MTSDTRPLVLIIDDHASFVAGLDEALSKRYTVLTALDGLEGYALACQYQPHAIVLDVNMPIVDGWTVLQKLRSNPTLAKVPVIILSGVERDATEQEAARFQVSTVLRKPCTLRDVEAALRTALRVGDHD
jgi:CheY-like chemotaxis protein